MMMSLALLVASGCVAVVARPSVEWRPPFLVKAPEYVAESFDKLIASTGDMTDDQIESSIERWVKRQSDSVQSNYLKFKQDRAYYEAAAEAQKQKMLQQMNPETRGAYYQIMGIFNHPTLTAQDKMMIIEKLLTALPEETRNEVQVLLQ